MVGFGDDPVDGLGGSERRRVEPPAGIAELAMHVGFEGFVPVEVEAFGGIPDLVAIPAGLDAWSKDDEQEPSRREQSRKKSSFAREGIMASISGVKPASAKLFATAQRLRCNSSTWRAASSAGSPNAQTNPFTIS